MKSFSGDEGYQAPCSPRLIEQEFYIANYVVCIPLVSTALSGGGARWCTRGSKTSGSFGQRRRECFNNSIPNFFCDDENERELSYFFQK